jgi:peptidoglycan/xylan/chitin deacetylase (PgdA/CDA1 family)
MAENSISEPASGNIGEDSVSLELSLDLIDNNGGDLYPGETLTAEIKIINKGNLPGEDIQVKLDPDENISTHIEDPAFIIEKLDPGESVTKSIDLKVKEEGISEDTQIFIRSGTDMDSAGIEDSMTIFGVGDYERGKIPIIGLHDILDEIDIPIELHTYHFDVLCKTLQDFGYSTITFKDLMDHIDHNRVLPEKSVILTSDDGFAGLYDNAFPILKKYSMVMTVFLVTNYIKDSQDERMTNFFDADRPVPMRPMLIWPEIREMYEYGCEFLSHSHNHIRLGLAGDEEFLYELETSKKEIESRLGSTVNIFAWPYDNHSFEKLELLDEAGYKGAVRYWGGMEDINTIDAGNIKRFEFNSYIPPSDYPGYLDLLDITFSSTLTPSSGPSEGEEFILEYKISNNDSLDLKITSFELDLENLDLAGMDDSGYISKDPAKVDNTFMWVGDDYSLAAGESISLHLKLKGIESGEAVSRFRITAYNAYFRAEDILLNIK